MEIVHVALLPEQGTKYNIAPPLAYLDCTARTHTLNMQIYENYKGVGGLTLRCIERVASYMLSSLNEVYQNISLVYFWLNFQPAP